MRKKFVSSILCFSLLSLTMPIFANSTGFYEPSETTVDEVNYLDGVPVYTEDEIKSGEVHDDIMNTAEELDGDALLVAGGYNEWTLIGQDNIYSGVDRDRFSNYSNSTVKRTLSAHSKTKYAVSGDVKFGFRNIAEIKIGGTIGQEWGETKQSEYSIKPRTVVELKAACMVPVYKYKYVRKGFGGVTRYYAEAYGNGGVQTWFFENSL